MLTRQSPAAYRLLPCQEVTANSMGQPMGVPALSEAAETEKPADPLESALKRFDLSLAQLERAVDQRLSRESARAGWEEEMRALREDRDRLEKELGATRDQARALEQVTDQVASRLDAAIRGIRTVLEQ
jgi:DNA anti-recombination protein RmuC